ncbi:hypothetical protein [Pseudodesulfovibrio piezophilus]|uniref:Periplasmic heavy metal sensor n=1 Tax=Pseudodesulfovibrio piezophilus (strain DSM 21447 / JCM 15486 / C1TLV30) TaxID=1322246 RepID=M1WPT3_PSEP2|nr:hypothetical protein [Pseudodesulfovibrio piezophilus]CCH48569.1 conserved protein of unknown function [Pseudodesulfovibrio piezophilus C1TLV30]
MQNWKVWTSFLTVFVAGAIVGIIGTGIFLKFHFTPPKDASSFRAMMRHHFLEEITDEVNPDPTAIPAITTIIDESLAELDHARQDMHIRLKGILKKGRDKIMTHLTPEQQERFDRLIRERKAGRKGMLNFLPPPPPPPFD